MTATSGYRDADGKIVPGPGPNLTLVGCRDTIAAGLLKNTPANMETWLKHTDEVKEGVYMPNYYKQGLTDEQVTEIVNYLERLKPGEGGPGAGLPVGSAVDPASVGILPASPVATPVQ
jgi:cytochrome c1